MLSVAIHPEYKAFLMAKHGAVCFGESLEDAFDVANRLEEDSKLLFEKERKTKSDSFCKKPWIDDYAQLIGFGKGSTNADDVEAAIMITEKNRAAAEYVKTAKPLSLKDALLQRGVYLFKYSKLKNKK